MDKNDSDLIQSIQTNNTELYEEIMVLKEIYLDDISLTPPPRENEGKVTKRLCVIQLEVHPATGEDIHNRWVSITIRISPPSDYPHSCPHIELLRPRGLSEESFNSLINDLQQHAQDNIGTAMIYNILELARDLLTNNNKPSTHCTICLESFHRCEEGGASEREDSGERVADMIMKDEESAGFVKTSCYHYYHVTCLLRYRRCVLEAFDREIHSYHHRQPQLTIPCPVCRRDIKEEVNNIMHTYTNKCAANKRSHDGDDDTSGGILNRDDDMNNRNNQKDSLKYNDNGYKINEDAKWKDSFIYVPTAEMRRWQEEMRGLFERQERKGGIIDIHKNVISISGADDEDPGGGADDNRRNDDDDSDNVGCGSVTVGLGGEVGGPEGVSAGVSGLTSGVGNFNVASVGGLSGESGCDRIIATGCCGVVSGSSVVGMVTSCEDSSYDGGAGGVVRSHEWLIGVDAGAATVRCEEYGGIGGSSGSFSVGSGGERSRGSGGSRIRGSGGGRSRARGRYVGNISSGSGRGGSGIYAKSGGGGYSNRRVSSISINGSSRENDGRSIVTTSKMHNSCNSIGLCRNDTQKADPSDNPDKVGLNYDTTKDTSGCSVKCGLGYDGEGSRPTINDVDRGRSERGRKVRRGKGWHASNHPSNAPSSSLH